MPLIGVLGYKKFVWFFLNQEGVYDWKDALKVEHNDPHEYALKLCGFHRHFVELNNPFIALGSVFTFIFLLTKTSMLAMSKKLLFATSKPPWYLRKILSFE